MFDEAKLQASFVKWRYVLVRIDLIFSHARRFLVKKCYNEADLLNEIIISLSDTISGQNNHFYPETLVILTRGVTFSISKSQTIECIYYL
jgi:hypothetical protein